MSRLLAIYASPRGTLSISRKFGERFIHHWLAANPEGTIVERDLMQPPVPYMNVDWVSGVHGPPEMERTPEMLAAMALSETLINELKTADEILICTPMYNFTVPAALKSWIDYIVRPEFTFQRGPGWPPLLHDRPTRVLIASRDVHDPDSDDDQVTPVIRRVFRFMGINDVRSLLVGNSMAVNLRQVRVEDHVARVEDDIAALVT